MYTRKTDEEIKEEAEFRLANNNNIVDITIKQSNKRRLDYLSYKQHDNSKVWEGCALDEQAIIDYLQLKR